MICKRDLKTLYKEWYNNPFIVGKLAKKVRKTINGDIMNTNKKY